jgi:hypothetical protein
VAANIELVAKHEKSDEETLADLIGMKHKDVIDLPRGKSRSRLGLE